VRSVSPGCGIAWGALDPERCSRNPDTLFDASIRSLFPGSHGVTGIRISTRNPPRSSDLPRVSSPPY
jgi:hypothetical protein